MSDWQFILLLAAIGAIGWKLGIFPLIKGKKGSQWL